MFTCAGFHLLMIQAVFSASCDNVLSALWEISVSWCDSLGSFRMSPALFLSPRSSQNFFLRSRLFFHPTFLLPPLAILTYSLFLYLTCLCVFVSLPEEREEPYLSPAHSPHFSLSPPSFLPPSSISTPGPSYSFVPFPSPACLSFSDCPCLAVSLSVYTPHFNILSSIPLTTPQSFVSPVPPSLLPVT